MSKLQVYAGSMVSTYRYASDKLSSDYATPDKKAPEIRGFVGKNSYNGSIPYQTIYSDQEKPMIISNMCMHRIIVMQR